MMPASLSCRGQARLLSIALSSSPIWRRLKLCISLLETLVVVLQELKSLSPVAAAATVTCFIQHWGKSVNDPLISELIDGAFGALLEFDDLAIVANLHEQVLPVIRDMLVQSAGELGAAGLGATIAGSAITVLKTIVKHSFVATTANEHQRGDEATRAMSSQLVQLVFEPLVNILDVVDDEKVLNSGAECLKWLVMFAVETLASYSCVTRGGCSGVDACMHIAAKLLSPTVDESCAVCVGGLVTQILLKLGSALPTTTIQSILSAIGSRLATAQLPSLVQSLCMVYARLVHTHGKEILDVLEQLPPPTLLPQSPRSRLVTNPAEYRTMLEFVFATWIEKQQEFYGLYCIKVTVSALLKVAEWNDARVMNIIVAGSEIEDGQGVQSDSTAGVQTRSKTKKMPAVRVKQHMRVHFLTKLFVVLAKVSSHLGEDEDEWETSDDESGDEDDEVDFDHSVSVTGSIFAPAEGYELLSDRLDSSAGAVGDDVEDIGELEEEFEAHFDPLNDVDLKVLIPATLQSVSANPELLQAIMPELTHADKEVLGAVAGGSA
ncbi:hypothetical protein PINS_up009550 [Pythium insidiosum]|nr:hypothetical protein PINS_up009550 [Pythium insidiosum]